MSRGPIFIIGAMGSGTTLLRLMLDSHPNVAIPPETGFMRVYDGYRYTPFKFSGRNWTKLIGWTPDERDALLREHFDQLFRRYAEQHGKGRWGEKSPLHTWHVPEMARLFPDAQFVMIVRHPGGSVHSNLRRFKRYESRPRTPVWHWEMHNRLLAQYAELLGERMVLLRFEELLQHPEPIMRSLLDWLGEEWDDSVLEHHDVQSQRGGKLKVEGSTRVDQPIDVSKKDSWMRSMPEDTRAWLAERLGGVGAFYGYSMTDASVLEPLDEPGSLVVPAAAVAARIDRFPELDLRREVERPAADSLHDPRKHVTISTEALEQLRARPKRLPPPPPPVPPISRQIAIAGVRRLPAPVRRVTIAGVRRAKAARRARAQAQVPAGTASRNGSGS